VLVLPVDGGVLCIRRGIEPHIGSLALPGGFVNYGESWQEGAARELFEETGIRTDPAAVRTLDVLSAPDSTILVFGEAAATTAAALPAFTPTDETTARVILQEPAPLAFPLHERVLRAWFAKRAASR
jgi:ADP-ribose pyrophosphatase YjhB (NUDIX family)